MPVRLISLLLLLGVLAGCNAPATSTSDISTLYVEGAYARPSPLPNGNSAIYLTIVNPLTVADRLQAAESRIGMASLHESITENNIASMQARLDGFEIPPGSQVELAPGGKHIMIMGIAEPLAIGDIVTVTLTFEQYGPMTITVPVEETPEK